MKDQTPCIFLKANTCTIYPVRPFICRAWNSLERSDCQAAFLSGDPCSEIENSPARNFMFSTAREIFMDMDNSLDLTTGFFTIPNAVGDCLGHTDALKRWCISQAVFTEIC